MDKDQFSDVVEAICLKDSRFDADAYLFVREALIYTARQEKKKLPRVGAGSGGGNSGSHHNVHAVGAVARDCNVTGQQLLDGVRRYALDQYGPMVPSVFAHWRINSCEDIGTIVFKLIEAGEFGKTEQDTIADFQGGFDFEEAFVRPFRPAKKTGSAAAASGSGQGATARPRRARNGASKTV